MVVWQTLGGSIRNGENSPQESGLSPGKRERYWLVDDCNQWEKVHAESNGGVGYPHLFARGKISNTYSLARKGEGYDEPETPRPTETLHSPVRICPPPQESHMINPAAKWAIQAVVRGRRDNTPDRQRYRRGWEIRANCRPRDNNGPLRSAVQVSPEGQRRLQSPLLLLRSLTRGIAQDGPQNRKPPAAESRTVRPSTFPQQPTLGTRTLNASEGKLNDESARQRLPLDKRTDSYFGKAMFSSTVPDDVRFNMLCIQQVRDRYLRYASLEIFFK